MPELLYAKEPQGRIPLQELRELVDSNAVRTVMLAVPDMQGRLKGKRYAAPHFMDQVAEAGAEFCAYLLATDIDMLPLGGYKHASWDTGYGDMGVVPDWSTVRRLPGEAGEVQVLGDARHRDGSPVAVAPRQILRRQLDRLSALGLTARAGLESEFIVYCGRGHQALGSLEPAFGHNADYALQHPALVGRFLRELEEALTGCGLPLEAVKTEAAPGQVEVTFRYGQALEAADNHTVFKHLTRQVADQTENTATFMAAPVTGVGSGLHAHISLWREEEPAPLDETKALTLLGEQVIGGLVEVLPQLMPLFMPYPNSYKRLRPGSFAPTRMCWGRDNRTCALRLVGHGRQAHLEIRIPGADANPYLVLAAVIAACQTGIDRQLKAPAPVTGNAYHTTAPMLPSDPGTGLTAFRSSQFAADLFRRDVLVHYARAAQHEIDVLGAAVTDTERDRGFARA